MATLAAMPTSVWIKTYPAITLSPVDLSDQSTTPDGEVTRQPAQLRTGTAAQKGPTRRWEECLRPVDRREGRTFPDRSMVIERGRRWRVGREGTPVFTVVPEDGSAEGGAALSLIDESVRDGAGRMLAAAFEVEVDAYLAEFVGERDGSGRRLVVRNGHARARQVSTAAGAVEVVAPRVNDRRVDPVTGERRRSSSAILPPWCRRTPKISEVLPLLYMHGLPSGDFVPALEQFLGTSAGLSAATVTRLTAQWQSEYKTFCGRDPSTVDYVHVWADGHPALLRSGGPGMRRLIPVGSSGPRPGVGSARPGGCQGPGCGVGRRLAGRATARRWP